MTGTADGDVDKSSEEAVIASILDVADKFGLRHEVMEEYNTLRMAGVEPEEAAFNALWEWDLFP